MPRGCKMRKWIIILVFLLLAQSGNTIIPVLAGGTKSNAAAQEKDSKEIKKIIEAFIDCGIRGDLDGVMSYASKDFSGIIGYSTLDYAGLRSHFENMFKNTADRSVSNLNFLELNLEGNKATVLIEHGVKAFNLKRAKDIEQLRRIKYGLIKEGGAWKIVSTEPN
jgi:ketosteroid isomerase-like protein